MEPRARVIGALLLLVTLTAAEAASAALLERLLMPGELISGHAEVEDQCDQCHADDDDIQQADLCVACHEHVGDDMTARTGYHGLDPNAQSQECVACHTDHEGREANIVILNPNAFDHTFTDFVLRGAHLRTTCAECHQPTVTWHETSSLCIDCHRQDDHHQGALGPQCGDCHTDLNWPETKFDHNQTGFALIGQHRDVECAACHTDEDYSVAPTQCSACHGKDDVHAGVAGHRCESCHTSFTWTTARFDHAAVSDFALIGGHTGLACQDCHESANLAALDGATCVSCHRSEDIHEGRNGTACADCHSVRQWDDISFDHQAISDFALLGAHSTLACESCHQGELTAPLQRSCVGCHGGDNDPHEGQLGNNCESCHDNASWVKSVKFDHDLALFPLLGVHAELSCDKCHASAAFHEADADCVSCHEQDDVHEGRLSNVCSQCHNPFDWARVDFDHDQTRFELSGAHDSVACDACHRTPTADKVSAPLVCGQCHRRDDTHSGRFGTDCGRCHTTRSFAEIREL